jgi:hypothetical protein
MLKDNEESQGFFKWQTAMKTFVGRLPGYLPGMLEKRPDYAKMTNKEQGRLRDIYTNIHSWLCKAVSVNSCVCSKTKHVRIHPYPDIVKWWRTVHELFSCSSTDLSRRKAKLHDHYQYDNEMCVPCFNRFEMRVTELEEMGTEMDDHENGVIFFNGLSPANKKVVTNFMALSDLDYTLSNMFAVAKWLDELDKESNPNKKKESKDSANLVTDPSPGNPHDQSDSRKRSRSRTLIRVRMMTVRRLSDLLFTLIGITEPPVTTDSPGIDPAAEEGTAVDGAMIVGEHRHHMPRIPRHATDPKIALVLKDQM